MNFLPVPSARNRSREVFALVGKAWVGLQLPSHVQHFSPNSLRVAALRAGLCVRQIETESIPEHVECELTNCLRQRFFIPGRLTRWTGILPSISARMARKGGATDRGDSIVAHFSPGPG
jgi:hypothetical protein